MYARATDGRIFFPMSSVRIGINPITWSNDDVPELGGDIALETCLAETKQAGYAGIELGGKFPRQSAVLKPIMEGFGLKIISGWYDGRCCEREVDAEMAAITPHLQLLKDMGARHVVYADTSRGRGQVVVDEHCHTGVDGVWAIGDCVRGPMLAHKGFEEGIAVAELIAGLPGHVNFDTIPYVIYTEPELAWVGKTEEQLKAEGVPYKAGSFPFAAVGRAVAMAEPAGFVKVLAHAETDTILGMHLIGANVSELVHEGVLAMEFKGSADDLARICHAHPSLSEAVHDAAMAVHKRAIHKAN